MISLFHFKRSQAMQVVTCGKIKRLVQLASLPDRFRANPMDIDIRIVESVNRCAKVTPELISA